MVEIRDTCEYDFAGIHGYHIERRSGFGRRKEGVGCQESDGEDGTATRTDGAVGVAVQLGRELYEWDGYYS